MDTDTVIKDALKEIQAWATANFKENSGILVNEAKTTVNALKDDLNRWSQMVLEQKLTHDDVEYLIRGRIAVEKMQALKLAGMTKAKVDKFKIAFVNIFIDALFKLLPS